MNLYGLQLTENVRFDVEDVDDYIVEGSFDPNAACDIDYFGCRETSFVITSFEEKNSSGHWWLSHNQTHKYLEYKYEDLIVQIVQKEIDRLKEEDKL